MTSPAQQIADLLEELIEDGRITDAHEAWALRAWLDSARAMYGDGEDFVIPDDYSAADQDSAQAEADASCIDEDEP